MTTWWVQTTPLAGESANHRERGARGGPVMRRRGGGTLRPKARFWIWIIVALVLLQLVAFVLLRTTDRKTFGPVGEISAMGFAFQADESVDPADYLVTTYATFDSGTRTVTAPEGVALAACRNRVFGLDGQAMVGTAWRFVANVSWCFSTGKNPRITSVSWGQSGQTFLPGWSYRGVSGDVRTGGVNQSYAYRRVTGQFELCVPFCVSSDFPWIAFTVRNNGTSTVDWGG
jgi:hypothetical protein